MGHCSCGERTYSSSSEHSVALGVSHISTGKVVPQDSKNPVIVSLLSLQDHIPGDLLFGATRPKAATVPLQDGSYVPAGMSIRVPGNITAFIVLEQNLDSPAHSMRKRPRGATSSHLSFF